MTTRNANEIIKASSRWELNSQHKFINALLHSRVSSSRIFFQGFVHRMWTGTLKYCKRNPYPENTCIVKKKHFYPFHWQRAFQDFASRVHFILEKNLWMGLGILASRLLEKRIILNWWCSDSNDVQMDFPQRASFAFTSTKIIRNKLSEQILLSENSLVDESSNTIFFQRERIHQACYHLWAKEKRDI
jgi:hypothetical protein